MKEVLEINYPDDKDIIIEVKSLNIEDDNMLTVDYDIVNTNPRGTIDDEAIGVFMEQWLKKLIDKTIEHSENICLHS